jgi:hypothetical protein
MIKLEKIAAEVIRCAITFQNPNDCVLGNITARELVLLASNSLPKCPLCGSEKWSNVDLCSLCEVCSSVITDGCRPEWFNP